MQLTHYLEQMQRDDSFLVNETVMAFVCPQDTFPILFTARLISFLKSKQIPIEMIQLENEELSSMLSRLETSFLGMKISYWLRGVELLDKKSRQQVLAYVGNYQGPHQLLCMITKDDASYFSKKMCIELPATLTCQNLSPLLPLFTKNSLAITKQMNTFVTKYDALNLDQFCMLIAYMQVVGKAEDYHQIAERVIESEYSLFTLAQHFFAKNRTDFYNLWALVKDRYPVTFWTTYWSEQLWRAYYTHHYLSKGQLPQAKLTAARLPFSFMQKDWKKVSSVQLKDAHQAMYNLDYAHKNSIETDAGLDLIFNQFFLN